MMRASKFLCAVSMLLVFATGIFAAENPDEVRGGMLRYLGVTEEAFQKSIDELNAAMRLSMLGVGSRKQAAETLEILKMFRDSHYIAKFFDSLPAMLMAMDAGRLDVISLPEATARYVMRNDPAYKILFSLRTPTAIAFGFREADLALRDEFNVAIASMKADDTLRAFEEKYIGDRFSFESDALGFVKVPGGDTIKIAVTGDMPPIDYVNESGMAAGYNTAVIAEIGKRLKKNIEIINIESGARSAALVSGRADVIFWYRMTEGMKLPEEAGINDNPLDKAMTDTTEGVILSEPYCRWDNELCITK